MKDDILIKFITEQCSDEQCGEVMEWIEKSVENKQHFAQLKNLWVASEINAVGQAIKIKSKNRRKIKILIHIARTAAAAAIVLGVYFLGRDNEKRAWQETTAMHYTQINVPQGETTSITLADGTTVRLNSNSNFRYSNSFNIKDRNVILDGEGYFEVSRNEDIPFIVNGLKLNIHVLGTKFNLTAYNEDRQIIATLYDGSIYVENFTVSESIILKPDEIYIYDKVTGEVTINKTHTNYSWRENYIVANVEDICEFAKKIERKYKVKVEIDESLKGNCTYTGVFRNESLIEVLKQMKNASIIDYQISGDTIRLVPNK